jgi:DNA polymerase I-like protein with 3'-5' exonuclease and polymerase domains
MSKYQPKSKKLKNVPKMKHIYIVNVLKRDKVQIQKKHKKTYISKEPIWCPIVPNTYFVARREAQVFITGNTPFQGLAADGAKLAAYRLIKEEEQVGYSLVNFVHDEFLFEFPDLGGYVDKSKVDYVLKVMCEEMEKLTPGVPIAGEYTVAKSWTKKNPNMRIEDNKIYF